MPDQPQPAPGTPSDSADSAVYGGQWGDGDKEKAPGTPPPDRPGKIETPPEKT
jgi:hypothetical protein